jgi:hypothetical protein
VTLAVARRWYRRAMWGVSHYEQYRRCGCSGVDGSFDTVELLAACPVLHECVEVGIALSFDDRVAPHLVGRLAALELGDTELGRCPIIIHYTSSAVDCKNAATRTRRR